MQNSFTARVNLAANYISQGRNSSRAFDSCFENYDGDAVVVALGRRAQARPDGNLAKNIGKYLSVDSVSSLVEKHSALSRSGLINLSQELQITARAEFQKVLAEQSARQSAARQQSA
jgi:hypothetical protein